MMQILLENVQRDQLASKFAVSCGTQRFITVLTKFCSGPYCKPDWYSLHDLILSWNQFQQRHYMEVTSPFTSDFQNTIRMRFSA